ncbi:MAG TPA: hypothetical protein VMP01_18885 [Pirellulaceae bacterium]|nr:hypothetical protein [Pirellulaceae bacterium]
MNVHYVGSILLLCLLNHRVLAQERVDFDPERALERAFGAAEGLRLRFLQTTWYKGGAYPTETKIGWIDATVIRHKEKWRVQGSRSTTRLKQGKSTTYSGEFEFLVDQRRFINVESSSGGVVDNEPAIAASFDKARIAARPGTSVLSDAEILFGFAPLRVSTPLAEMVKANAATRTITQDPSANAETINFEDEYGRWEVILSVDKKLPTAIHNFKDADDLAGSVRVHTWEGGGIYPEGNAIAYEVHVEPIDWTDELGSTLIRSYTVRAILTFSSGGKFEKRSEVEVSDPGLLTAEVPTDFKIATPIRNKTPVHVQETPEIAYEWWEGDIRKKVDIDALENLADIRFRQPTSSYFTMSRIIFLGSLLVLVASLSWFFYQRLSVR